MDTVVRVATNNNFNCTKAEWDQLDSFARKHPNAAFFINSNIKTPKLHTIAAHPYKAVITVNPDILVTKSTRILQKLNAIKSRLAFVRVKYIPDNQDILDTLTALIQNGLPVIITLQRFNGKKTLTKYTDLKNYGFSCSRYRLTGNALTEITNIVTSCQSKDLPVWICDQSGKGCQECRLCSRLTTGQDLKITSLNLSTSGICPYNCPDCYAKTLQHFALSQGNRPIIYDKIQQNEKQAGRTAHILQLKSGDAHVLLSEPTYPHAPESAVYKRTGTYRTVHR